MGYYKPVIEFDKYHFRTFIGRTFKEIHEEMRELRLAVKKAAKYTWDNSHFRISDIYGKPALSISFYDNDFSLWNFKTGDSLGILTSKDGKFTEENFNELDKMIGFIEKKKRKCLKCGEWVNKGKTYSFAGFVCDECYDPEIHLPPDPS